MRYELTGGFIKNAILSALSIAVSRDGDNPLITQSDLLKGASLQLRGRLRMKVCVCTCVCACVRVCVCHTHVCNTNASLTILNASRISIVALYQLVVWMK